MESLGLVYGEVKGAMGYMGKVYGEVDGSNEAYGNVAWCMKKWM